MSATWAANQAAHDDGWETVRGNSVQPWHLYRILSSPLYIGRIPHKDRSYDGEHEAIVNTETWDKVQTQLATNAGRKRGRTSSKHPSLLAGLLFTAEGVPFTPSHAINHGRRYRYYVERSLITTDAPKAKSGARQRNESANGLQSKGWRLPAREIEQLVLKQLAAFLRERGRLLDALHFKGKSPDLVSALLARASKLVDGCETGSFASQSELVAATVQRIAVAQDRVIIEIDLKALTDRLLNQEGFSTSKSENHRAILIEVPVRFQRRGVEAKLAVLDQQQPASGPDPNLVKALARAHEWFGRIARGEANGIGDIALAEQLCRTYVTRMLCLAFLAPETTKSILEGRQPSELTAKRLIRSALGIPLLWIDQRLRNTSL